MTWPAGDVQWTGEPAAEYRSSPSVLRGFCRRCGTALTYRREDDPGWLDVTVASLNNPPEAHAGPDRERMIDDLDELPVWPVETDGDAGAVTAVRVRVERVVLRPLVVCLPGGVRALKKDVRLAVIVALVFFLFRVQLPVQAA